MVRFWLGLHNIVRGFTHFKNEVTKGPLIIQTMILKFQVGFWHFGQESVGYQCYKSVGVLFPVVHWSVCLYVNGLITTAFSSTLTSSNVMNLAFVCCAVFAQDCYGYLRSFMYP